MAPTERELIAHLYRRAGFGATAHELEKAARHGYEACVDELVAGLDGPVNERALLVPRLTTMASFKPGVNLYDEHITLYNWWVDTMVTTRLPLREKLVLLLHNQFPTAISKVGWPSMMLAQNQIFRTHGPGRYDELVRVVAKDPAMLIWLDASSDVAKAPNENFARELMERFTMGIGSYTQHDVHDAARAFCGWSFDYRNGKFTYDDQGVDTGVKTVLGHTGDLSGDDVIAIVTHDPACAPFVTARLWSWLAYPVTPEDPVVRDLAPGFARGLRLGDLVASMLRHPAFVSDQSLNGLVKQPAEWVVATMRRLRLTTAHLHGANLIWLMGVLGQELFNPPNVGGWGLNEYWLSTATSQSRLYFAYGLANSADSSLAELDVVPTTLRADWLATTLGVTRWSNTTLRAFGHQWTNPPALLALALVSPEYCVN